MDKSNKPPGEPELEGDHEIMMQNFEKHLGDEATIILQWICQSIQLLHVAQLAEATNLQTNVLFARLESCGQYIMLDGAGPPASRVISLIHPSARQHIIDSQFNGNEYLGHLRLTHTCLAALEKSSLQERPMDKDEWLDHRWSFLHYAARNWPEHARQAWSKDLFKEKRAFFCTPSVVDNWAKTVNQFRGPRYIVVRFPDEFPIPTTRLSLACGLYLPLWVETILEDCAPDEKKRLIDAVDDADGTPLYWAIRCIDLRPQKTLIRCLLRHGATVDQAIGPDGLYALHRAVRKVGLVKDLLDHGASVDVAVKATARSLRICKKLNMSDSSISGGKTPLILGAAENAPISSLQLLLDRGASPHVACTEGRTALMHAACSNHSGVVKLLLSHDFNPDARDNDGWTALLLAANDNQGSINGRTVSTAQQLLDSGFDPRAVGSDGRTAMHIAVFAGNTELINVLLEHGLDVDARGHDGSTALMRAARVGHLAAVRELIQAKADVNAVDGDGRTVMMWAMNKVCDIRVLDCLLGRGADLHIQLRRDGDTLLHDTARKGNLKGVGFLLDNQLNIEIRNKLGKTPLMRAISANQVEVVKVLLDRGSDVNARGELVKEPDFTVSTSPLTEAIEIGNLDILQQLLAKGATIGVPDHEEETALLFTVSRGQREQDKIAALFLDRGSDPDHRNAAGMSALAMSTQKGHLSVVKILLEHGADVNITTANLNTPLIMASRFGYEQIAEVLLKRGPNIEACDDEGDPALLVAAVRGHTEITKLLLDYGAQLSSVSPSKNNRSALALASLGGHESVVRLLLEREAQIEVYDDNRDSPLTLAALNGHEGVVKILLEAGANVNIATQRADGAVTPLQIASSRGHHEVVQSLLEGGANPEAPDGKGLTALTLAVQNGHAEVVKALAKGGANAEALDEDGGTALHCAIWNKNTGVTKALVDGGAKLEALNQNGNAPLQFASMIGSSLNVEALLAGGADTETRSLNGNTALICAVMHGQPSVIKILIERGASVEVLDKESNTPLLIASLEGYVKTAQALVEGGANIEARNQYGNTGLHLASYNGHTAVVKVLLEAGARTDTTNKYGYTALHHASMKGYAEAAKVLIESGAHTDTLDHVGDTALHCASLEGHTAVVKVLLEEGADAEARRHNGNTPLLCAAICGHTAEVAVLLEAGADIEACDNNGNTASVRAAQNGHAEVIKILLAKGAVIEARDNRGSTAFLSAVLNGHAEAVEALIAGGANIEAPFHDGSTALVRAVADKMEAVVKVLVEGGASTQVRDPRANTPLIIAITKDSEASFEVLVQAGADINAFGEGHMSTLSYAALEGRTRMTKTLLEAGAKVEGCPGEVGSPLIWAVRKGSLPTVQALLEGGANAGIEAHDHDGHTALTCAVERNSADLIRALLKAGANTEGRHKNGRTPLLIAAADGHPVAVKTLLEVGAADEPVLAWLFNRFESLMAKFLSTASKSRKEIEVMRRRLANSEKPSRRTIATYMKCVDHHVISKEDELSSCELPGCFQLWEKMLAFLTDLLSRQGILGEVLELWQSVESLINGASQQIVAVGYQGQLKEDYRLSQSEAAGLQNQMIELIDMIREEALVFFESPSENMSLRSTPLSQSSESSSTPKTSEKYPSKDLGNNLDLNSVASPAPKRGDAWEKFAFWPPWSNSRSGAHYLSKMLALVASGACDMGSISPIWREDTDGLENLKRLVGVAQERCVVALCQAWHQDAETFKFVEDWVQPDDGGGITMMPASLAAFEGAVLSGMQKILCIPGAVSKPEAADLVPPPPPKVCQMIKSQYITTIYVVLGGMVKNAEMSATRVDEDDEDSDVESYTAASGPASGQASKVESRGAARACDQNTRMLLTIGNIKHLQFEVLPSLNDQLENVLSTKFADDRDKLSDVLKHIDARIFQSYTRPMVQKLAEAISAGVTSPNWMPAPGRKPRNASPFTYHVLRELVVVKKNILATASASLASRVLSFLLEIVCGEMTKALSSYTSLNSEALL